MTWQVGASTDAQGMYACNVSTYSSPQGTQTANGWLDGSLDAPTGTPRAPPASPITIDVRWGLAGWRRLVRGAA
jgi:hypothetical protein